MKTKGRNAPAYLGVAEHEGGGVEKRGGAEARRDGKVALRRSCSARTRPAAGVGEAGGGQEVVVAAAIAWGRGASSGGSGATIGGASVALVGSRAASCEALREAARGGIAADVGVHCRWGIRLLRGRLLGSGGGGRHGTCKQVRERLQFMLGVLVVEETGGYAYGTVRLVVALGGHKRRRRRHAIRALH